MFALRCAGSYYGAQCEIDGEVLGVAIGASVAAVIIIVSTLICLCMWRWAQPFFYVSTDLQKTFNLQFLNEDLKINYDKYEIYIRWTLDMHNPMGSGIGLNIAMVG